MVHSLENVELREQYERAGFGGRVGWGARPALLVIDMAQGWTRTENPLGSDLSGVLAEIKRICAVARRRNIPIIFTTMGSDPSSGERGEFAPPKLRGGGLQRGTPSVELEPELDRRQGEPLVEKPRASAFFATNVLSMLLSHRVDTVIVVGCSTSGCIRATCESAFNYDFRVIVPKTAVGDRSPSAHEASLFDIDMRFGDVVNVDEVIEHLAGVGTTPDHLAE